MNSEEEASAGVAGWVEGGALIAACVLQRHIGNNKVLAGHLKCRVTFMHLAE